MLRISVFQLVILTGSAFIPVTASAECRGFIGCLVDDVPLVGDAAKMVDDGIAELKDRGSSEDVLNHATSLKSWDNPIGRPAAPSTNSPAIPPAVTLNFCESGAKQSKVRGTHVECHSAGVNWKAAIEYLCRLGVGKVEIVTPNEGVVSCDDSGSGLGGFILSKRSYRSGNTFYLVSDKAIGR